MNRPRIALLGVAAVLVLAAGMAWRFEQDRVQADATRAAASQELFEINAAIVRESERLQALAREKAELVATASSRENARQGAASESAAATPKTAAETFSDFLRQTKDDHQRPESQLRALEHERARLDEKYGVFARWSEISPEQFARLKEIRLRQVEQDWDVVGAANAQGLPLSDPVVVQLRGEIVQASERALGELLGDAGIARLKDYERTASLRTIVGKVAGAATLAGVPLSPQQAEQLLLVMAQASANYQRGWAADVSDIDWTAVEANVGAVLGPEQRGFMSSIEPPGGMLHARWNTAVVKALKEREPGSGK